MRKQSLAPCRAGFLSVRCFGAYSILMHFDFPQGKRLIICQVAFLQSIRSWNLEFSRFPFHRVLSLCKTMNTGGASFSCNVHQNVLLGLWSSQEGGTHRDALIALIWGSQPGWFSPWFSPQHLTVSGNTFVRYNWRECYWHIVGRDQRCCSASYDAQDRTSILPHSKRIMWPKMSIVQMLRNYINSTSEW